MTIKSFHQNKPVLVLLAVLAAWWVAPAAVKHFTRTGFHEFQAPAWTALSYLQDLPRYWSLRGHSKNELIEAGRDLARLNAAYELKLQELESLRRELKRWEELLSLPPRPEFHYEPARTILRDLNGWWHECLIRKGRRHGVTEGAGVVCASGAVGRVKEAYLHTALVELASSPAFRIAAHLDGDPRPVVYQGAAGNILTAPGGRVSNVPADITPKPGAPMKLTTSPLGGTFPGGLPIGTVHDLRIREDGLFQTGRVELDPRRISLREVTVLIPLQSLPLP